MTPPGCMAIDASIGIVPGGIVFEVGGSCATTKVYVWSGIASAVSSQVCCSGLQAFGAVMMKCALPCGVGVDQS